MKIKEYREKHGLSQEAFGVRVGVSQGMVWQWEAGKPITLPKAKKIFRATDGEVTPHDCIPDSFPPGFVFPPDEPAPEEGAAAFPKSAAA